MAKRQVISCPWQDEQGNVLAGGTIVFEASGDALVSGTGELCSGIKGNLTLDINGTVAASPAQYMWPTDQMVPGNITYTVRVYNANGQIAWGPNYGLTVPSGAGSFNLCTWVPNQIGASSGASAGSLTLQTNGVNNGSQQLLDLQEGSNITIVDNGAGQITISGSGSNGPRTRGWHGWSPDGSTGSLTPPYGVGCTPNNGGNLAGIPPTTTAPLMIGVGTGTSPSTLAYLDANATTSTPGDSFTLAILGLSEIRGQVPALTHIRTWIGMMNDMESGANFWQSDTPPEATVAFRYSTAAGDVNWQCVVTDGTTQVTVDSGVAVNSSMHTFGIEFSSPNCLFFLDGVLVATVAITTTTLTSASHFSPAVTVDNVGLGNNEVFNLAYFYWDTNV